LILGALSQIRASKVPAVIEEETSMNGGPSVAQMSPAELQKIEDQKVFATPPINQERIKPSRERSQEKVEEHIVEFEQALLSLQAILNIANPCMKKTMMIAPKKFVGKVANS